jgi:hypothetical protein
MGGKKMSEAGRLKSHQIFLFHWGGLPPPTMFVSRGALGRPASPPPVASLHSFWEWLRPMKSFIKEQNTKKVYENEIIRSPPIL